MLLWPVLLGAGALLSLTTRHFIVLSIAAGVSIGVYFIGYNFTGHLMIGNLFRHPLYLLRISRFLPEHAIRRYKVSAVRRAILGLSALRSLLFLLLFQLERACSAHGLASCSSAGMDSHC